jgi:HK97 family phage major capsid protein
MDSDIKAALKELQEAYLDGVKVSTDAIADLSARIEAIELNAQRPALGQNAPQFKAFEAYLRGGHAKLTDEYRASLIVSDDTKGGYLQAPYEIEAGILKSLNEWSPIRVLATVRSISTAGVSMARQLTLPTAAWVGETEQRPETTITWGRLDIPVHTMACYIDVSLELLEDAAYDVVGEITTELGKAFGKLEAAAHLTGDGHKKPLGILNTDGVDSIASGVADNFTADSLLDTFYALPEVYAKNANWLANRTTIGKVRKLKSGDGQYLWSDSLVAGTPPSYNGRPMVEDPDMPNVGAGLRPVLFGDLSHFKIYDRVGLSLLRDDFSRATHGEVRFHARRRTGAGLTMPEAIKALHIGTSV